MHTRRTSLLAGMALLVAATVLLCFVRNFAGYVIARVLQGLSSAVVWIVGMFTED